MYAVEFSHRSGRDLVEMAKRRPNIVPIVEDARHPLKYRSLVSLVDVIFADVAQPDQVGTPRDPSSFCWGLLFARHAFAVGGPRAIWSR